MSRTCIWVVLVACVCASALAGGSDGGAEQPDGAARERRAPSGFLGMRGKKDVSATELQDLPTYYEDYGLPLRGKKAPSGFLGMRGKKSDDESLDAPSDESDLQYLLKRAPSGFLGMRGKKTPSGFLGMRGKKATMGGYTQEDLDYYLPIWQALSGAQEKRAPSGFLGMRGKKWADQMEEDMPFYHKRAPSGFLGMRG